MSREVKWPLLALVTLVSHIPALLARQVPAQSRRSDDQFRFFDMAAPDLGLENLQRDINSIYTGWVNASNGLYPQFLKVIYRPGVAGAVLKTAS